MSKIFSLLPLLPLACSPDVESFCGAGENLLAWQVQTNGKVATTSLPHDACRRQTELVSDLLPGGEVSISRVLPIPAGYVRPYVEVDSGATAACAQITVSLDAASHVGPVASFAATSGAPTASIRAAAQERCSVHLRPRLQIGDGP
jgi:hypothetical protein